MQQKRVIHWEKWKNPYGKYYKHDENEDDGYEKDGFVKLKEYEKNHENDEDEHPSVIFFTPLGPVPLTEHNDPEHVFNFWIGHCNFNITDKIAKIINQAEGVEICNIYTRYRFRIGVGKMFTPQYVTNNINKKISEHFYPNEQKSVGPDISNTGQRYQSLKE